MLKFLKKNYTILVAIVVIIYFSSDLKQNFKQVKLETQNKNGIKLTISTNWFEFKDGGGHNTIHVSREYSSKQSGVNSRKYYFGENRNERIDSIIDIEWLRNDSLIVIRTKLKSMEEKIDSLFWLKNSY